MMEVKRKCDRCGDESYVCKGDGSEAYCYDCWKLRIEACEAALEAELVVKTSLN